MLDGWMDGRQMAGLGLPPYFPRAHQRQWQRCRLSLPLPPYLSICTSTTTTAGDMYTTSSSRDPVQTFSFTHPRYSTTVALYNLRHSPHACIYISFKSPTETCVTSPHTRNSPYSPFASPSVSRRGRAGAGSVCKSGSLSPAQCMHSRILVSGSGIVCLIQKDFSLSLSALSYLHPPPSRFPVRPLLSLNGISPSRLREK